MNAPTNITTDQLTKLDSLGMWTETEAAREILDRLAIDPPELKQHRDVKGDQVTRYVGADALSLRCIYHTFMAMLLSRADLSGDYSDYMANAALPVEAAIEATVAAHAEKREAA